ncbi:hypothetical protein HDU91_006896 [Kappamyces sp. JEL0680]|nr:hypothetical protein HDU91_006896 [Kappamyces sp. JEL0680]
MQKEAIRRQLLQMYRIQDTVPHQRVTSRWQSDNKCGFLLGVVEHGLDIHAAELEQVLAARDHSRLDMFVAKCYNHYIWPVLQRNWSCFTPSGSEHSPASPDGSPSIEREHAGLKRALVERDRVCVFCWREFDLHAAHIVAQTNLLFEPAGPLLFQQMGIDHRHRVQNGLLLCVMCFEHFEKLRYYVDDVDGKLVVRVVNRARAPDDDEDRHWKSEIRVLKAVRTQREEDWRDRDNRKAIDASGELGIWFWKEFADDSGGAVVSLRPSSVALEFHKTACLLWQMAGGADLDVEYERQGAVNTAALKARFNIRD